MFSRVIFLLVPYLLLSTATAETGTTERGTTNCLINVCFALDGSDDVTESIYQRERFLTIEVTRALPRDTPLGLAAVQYGVASSAISSLTSRRYSFIELVLQSELQGASATFRASGLNYCFNELFDDVRERGDSDCVGSIIVMGDGMGEIGADPVERARLFEEIGGSVFTVGFGNANFTALTAIAGSEDRTFDGRGISLRRLADVIVGKL